MEIKEKIVGFNAIDWWHSVCRDTDFCKTYKCHGMSTKYVLRFFLLSKCIQI